MEAAAVVRSIRERTLDRIAMPEAPLDVLAQQIVAAVAAESLDVGRAARALPPAPRPIAVSRVTTFLSGRARASPSRCPPRSRASRRASCGTA